MALLNEHQQAQRGRKIGLFLLPALMSPLLVGQIIGACFAFTMFCKIIGKSANIFTDLLILSAGVLAHLGVLGFFFFVLTDFEFDTLGFWILGVCQFIPNFILVKTFESRGFLTED